MTDRWSNPSGGLGTHRFRVWPTGPDSYDHAELTANWDTLDGILGIPSAGTWPPTTGVDGGIYKIIKDILDAMLTLSDISAEGPYASIGSAATRGAGFFYLATDLYGGTLFRSNGSIWRQVALGVEQGIVFVTPDQFNAITSPFSGQEVILVDSLPGVVPQQVPSGLTQSTFPTGPVYRWNLAYNPDNTTSHKWEFLGGTPIVVHSPDQFVEFSSDQTATFVDVPGMGIAVPASGTYIIEMSAEIKGIGESAKFGAIAIDTGDFPRVFPGNAGKFKKAINPYLPHMLMISHDAPDLEKFQFATRWVIAELAKDDVIKMIQLGWKKKKIYTRNRQIKITPINIGSVATDEGLFIESP